MDVCGPFGIEHPTTGRRPRPPAWPRSAHAAARFQRRIKRFDRVRERPRPDASLRSMLVRLGYAVGRHRGPSITAFEERAKCADQPVRVSAKGRSIREQYKDRQIKRVEALARADHRAGSGRRSPPPTAWSRTPTLLQMRRDLTATAFHTANRLVPDIEHIADPPATLEPACLAFLEEVRTAKERPRRRPKVAKVERYLQDRLSALRHCGARGRGAAVGDGRECFLHLRADRQVGDARPHRPAVGPRAGRLPDRRPRRVHLGPPSLDHRRHRLPRPPAAADQRLSRAGLRWHLRLLGSVHVLHLPAAVGCSRELSF